MFSMSSSTSPDVTLAPPTPDSPYHKLWPVLFGSPQEYYPFLDPGRPIEGHWKLFGVQPPPSFSIPLPPTSFVHPSEWCEPTPMRQNLISLPELVRPPIVPSSLPRPSAPTRQLKIPPQKGKKEWPCLEPRCSMVFKKKNALELVSPTCFPFHATCSKTGISTC